MIDYFEWLPDKLLVWSFFPELDERSLKAVACVCRRFNMLIQSFVQSAVFKAQLAGAGVAPTRSQFGLAAC